MQNQTPVKIIKYDNRKLYDTSSASYTSIGVLIEKYVKQDIPFQIVDRYTNKDVTLGSLAHALRRVVQNRGNIDAALILLKQNLDNVSN